MAASNDTVTVTVTIPREDAFRLMALYARQPGSAPAPARRTATNVRKYLAAAIIHFAAVNARRAETRARNVENGADLYEISLQREIFDWVIGALTVLENAKRRSLRATAKRRNARETQTASEALTLMELDW